VTDLEREAREAAKKLWLGLDPFPIMARSAFVDGYLAAAAPREQELRRLRLLAEEQLTTLRKLKAEMLSDTRDQEIERLRARVAGLEGMVPKWVEWDSDERRNLTKAGAVGIGDDELIEGKWHRLMVPPIPLPETKA
jgi:HD-GYP domain-containing protein (c-di-GMP phosphodiesterase class II)